MHGASPWLPGVSGDHDCRVLPAFPDGVRDEPLRGVRPLGHRREKLRPGLPVGTLGNGACRILHRPQVHRGVLRKIVAEIPVSVCHDAADPVVADENGLGVHLPLSGPRRTDELHVRAGGCGTVGTTPLADAHDERQGENDDQDDSGSRSQPGATLVRQER
ncbi:hypothetical protein [Corynebacterium variabile]|uniref:hypothetical protein n=1 Tax=Corynebacterium variabile TaxID=1727 RepID=UPI002898C1FE|nr:hypothetical protein [Corynebacterium variabile]